jgi:fibro-slime domain-containing protein
VCGDGIQTCQAGYWTACEIPPSVRACQNDCGAGEQTCTDERWGECMVAPVTMACEDECGVGQQLCENGEWGECDVPDVERFCQSACGEGTEVCSDGEWSRCDAPPPLPPTLTATIRDFKAIHPDFEEFLQGTGTGKTGEKGIVAQTLGADGKPVYLGGSFLTTSGAANFNEWFRDVPGVNLTTTIELPLQASAQDPRLFHYESRNFFPIDGELFGNEGYAHNYHFTLEVAAEFKYVGGETFRFNGDDDVWVFVNGHLVIDLGGLHEALNAEVSLDEIASEVGIVTGNTYSLHIFFAERHTVSSNFIIDTSIAAEADCP